MELLMSNDWSLPNHLMSFRDGSDNQQNSYNNQRFQQQQQPTTSSNISSPSTPSAFAAQFMSGTPEQGMLLRALAEQQDEGRNVHNNQHGNLQEQLLSIQISPRIATRSSNNNITAPQQPYQNQSQNTGGLYDMQSHSAQQHQLSGFHVNPTPSQPIFTTTVSAAASSQPSPTWEQSPLSQRPNQTFPPGQQISDNELFTRQRQTGIVGSPQSDIFSSPEDQRRQLAFTPSRASHSSLHSVREDDLQAFTGSPSNLLSSSTHQSPLTTLTNIPGTTDVMTGFVRRSSAEINALRQRRQVRRTYTGPSSVSGFYSPTIRSSETNIPSSSSSSSTQRSVTQSNRRPRPISAGYQGFQVGGVGEDRNPAGTISASTSFSSGQYSAADDGTSRTLSDGTPGGKGEIPPSLSAELAGLGLDVDKFYKSTMMQGDRSNNEYEEDVFMDTEDTSMQRTSSSSSASTTKRRTAIGDQSLFSQNTTASSGLDDSIYSTNDEMDNSRWVHGRDTPPVSPSRSGSRNSLSISDHHAMRKNKDIQMTTTASDMGPSSDFLQPSTKQYSGSRLSIGGMEYPQTWPRTFSAGSGAAGTMSSSTDSSTQNTPSLSSSTVFIGPERSRNNARSPIQHSRSDNPIYNSGRSPQLRLARSPSTSSSISQQKDSTAASTIAAASAATGSNTSRRNRPSSRLFTTLEAANLSVESLRSDYAPSLTSRMRSGSSIGVESSGRGKERNKRWSTSFINPPSTFDQPINRRRAGIGADSDQYEEVSNALDTLRAFLRQRDVGNNAKQKIIPSRRSSNSQFGNLTAMSNEALQSAQQQQGIETSSASSSGQSSGHQKVLRHPPAGPLPPRGTLYDRNEGAAFQAQEMASRSSSNSLSPSTSFNLSPLANDPRSQIHTNNMTPSMSNELQRQQRQHNRSTSSASLDRIAALEDLADRVRRMREEDRSMQLSMQENEHFSHHHP